MLFEIDSNLACYILAFLTPIIYYGYRLCSQLLEYRARYQTIDQCTRIITQNPNLFTNLGRGFCCLLGTQTDLSTVKKCCDVSFTDNNANQILKLCESMIENVTIFLEENDHEGGINYLADVINKLKKDPNYAPYHAILDKCMELINSYRRTSSNNCSDVSDSYQCTSCDCSSSTCSLDESSCDSDAHEDFIDHTCLYQDCDEYIRMLKERIWPKLPNKEDQQILDEICHTMKRNCHQQIALVQSLSKLNCCCRHRNKHKFQFPSYETCQNMMEVAKYFDDPEQQGLCCEFSNMSKEEAHKILNQLSQELYSENKTIDTSKFSIPNQKMADFLRLFCYISLNHQQFYSLFYPCFKQCFDKGNTVDQPSDQAQQHNDKLPSDEDTTDKE